MPDVSSLKVGDRVAVFGRSLSHQGKPTAIRKVSKVDKRYIELDDGTVFRADNGYLKGDKGYHVPHIEPWKQEHADAIVRINTISALSSKDWNKLSNDQLKAIYALVSKAFKDAEAEEKAGSNG